MIQISRGRLSTMIRLIRGLNLRESTRENDRLWLPHRMMLLHNDVLK